jgi:nucleotide-binding universal stress UspA family protein
MVHVEAGRSNAGLLQIAGDLAERFHSSVIGIAACQPMPITYGDGFISADLIAQDREEVTKDLQEAEAEFRSALQARVATLEWRSTVMLTSLADYIACEARCADLIIAGIASSGLFDASRAANASDLVMQTGRPVLIVPAAMDKLKLERVLIGWKDTREARRAVFDAVPLLQKAGHVAVVEIAADDEQLAAARVHLEDVARWLERHGVAAELLARPSTGDNTTQMHAIAHEQDADVIVAGAYGHSRLREWVLGGVTRDLLLRANRCSFVSH